MSSSVGIRLTNRAKPCSHVTRSNHRETVGLPALSGHRTMRRAAPDPAPSPGRCPGRRPLPHPSRSPPATEQTDRPRLQVAAAARRVGVAPSTLRTWDRRYGIGPTDHTPGRHRRYSPDDLARLDLMHRALIRGATPADAAAHALTALPPHPDAGLPSAATTGAPRDRNSARDVHRRHGGRRSWATAPAPGPHRRDGAAPARRRMASPGLGRAALALDADAVRGLLAESIAATGVQATWDDVTRPVLAAVAQRWADTGAGIEIEHLLSDCVTAVFSAVAATAAPAAYRAAGTARRDGRRSPPATPGRARHDTRPAGRVLQVAGRRPASDGTGDGDPAHRTGRGAAVVPAEIHRRPAGPAVAAAHPARLPRLRRRPRLGGVDLPPQIGRLGSLEEATDALSAAATG